MSSASSELATIISALVGAFVAMRRSRRAQRTIAKLDVLALRKPMNKPQLAVLGALLGALTYRQFGFSLEMVAYGLMIAMCIEQSIIDYATHRLPRGVTFRAVIVGGPLLALAAINHDDNGRIGVMFASFVVTLALLHCSLPSAKVASVEAMYVLLQCLQCFLVGSVHQTYI